MVIKRWLKHPKGYYVTKKQPLKICIPRTLPSKGIK